MVKTKKYPMLYESKILNDFFTKEKITTTQKQVYISRIGLYLQWRKITLAAFIDLLKEDSKAEEKTLNQYAEYCSKNKKIKYSSNYASAVRRFIRFLGYKIDSQLSAIRKREKLIFFDDDPMMEQFLDLYRNSDYSESHTRRANRSLNEFCLWCGKTPTQIAKELITPEELTQLLLKFKNVRTKDNDKFGWNKLLNSTWQLKLQAIQYFYLRIHIPSVRDLLLTKEKKVRKDGTVRGMRLDKRSMITKEEIRKLLDSLSNYRQKAIVSALFESGLSISDLLEIKYYQIKEKTDFDTLENNPKAISFYHIRQKTQVGFFACFGENAIRYITLHLKERKQLYKKEIEDTEYVFSCNKQPNSKSHAGAIRVILHSKTEQLGIDKIRLHDFRRTFSTLATRTGKLLEHQIRSMMGHLNVSMGQVYDVSKEVEVLEDYLKIYDECFNITYDDLKYQSLEAENREIRTALKDVSRVLESLFTIYSDPAGQVNLTKEDLEKALDRLRTLGK